VRKKEILPKVIVTKKKGSGNLWKTKLAWGGNSMENRQEGSHGGDVRHRKKKKK